MRFLIVDDSIQSAIFLDENNLNEPTNPYIQLFNRAFYINPNIQNSLLIGGGAFSYPRSYLSYHENAKIDVVEINKAVVDISSKYFQLNDLMESSSNRLNIIVDDGINFINTTNNKYDAIFIDAFIGASNSSFLENNIKSIKSLLNENGVFCENIVSALKGKHSFELNSKITTYEKEFKYVETLPCFDYLDDDEMQNYIIFASDSPIEF